MRDFELFAYGLIALAWVIFQVIRRVVKPPRPLGTIEEEPPPEVPAAPEPVRSRSLDTQWGRASAPAPIVVPALDAVEPYRWSVDAAQAELDTGRQQARRQERARAERTAAAQRIRQPHPLRPRLRTANDLRNAVVLSAVIGPCRAIEPWQPPQEPR